MKPVLVLLVFAHCFVEHVVSLVHPKYNCYGRPNERFTETYNARCERHCEDGPGEKACPAVFTNVEGCYCKPDYYRNSQGICVELWQCDNLPQPQLDPCWQRPNEEFTKHFRPECEPTCDSPNKPCTLQLVHQDGCTCKPGFLRNFFGVCVESWQCQANPGPPIWNQQQLLQWLQPKKEPERVFAYTPAR